MGMGMRGASTDFIKAETVIERLKSAQKQTERYKYKGVAFSSVLAAAGQRERSR